MRAFLWVNDMKRAYSLFEIKNFDDDKRELEGIATTPTPDRMGDIVEPKGAVFKTPLPLLWQHMSDKPIGNVTEAKVTDDGIRIKARLAKSDAPGSLKDRLDEAWESLKLGLVRGLSIGFSPLESSQIKDTFSYRFTSWEWLELSAVTIPANAEASIQTVKSIDTELRAASGRGQRGSKPAGVTAKRVALEGKTMKISEQLASWEAKRASTVAALEEMMQKSIDDGESLDDEQEEKYEELSVEVKTIDKQLARLRDFEKLQAEKAQPVEVREPARGPTVFVRKEDPEDEFPGQGFTRRVIARTIAYMSQGEMRAGDVAEQRWGKSHPKLVQLIKSGVSAGGSASGEWGAELTTADSRYTGDFIEFLYSKTVFNQLPLRSIPDNVTIKGQDGGSTAFWVSEGLGIPVTTADFSDVTLRSLKVAAIAVITKELMKRSSPSAEMLVRDSLVNAAAQRIDLTFLGTAGAGTGSPAGILNGLSSLGSNGSDADAVLADIRELYAPFITAKNASGLYYVMSRSLAKSVSLMRNALGQTEFTGLNANGGTLEGDPVITGDNVPDGYVILMKPSDIFKIGDTGIEVSVSDQATIEQDTAPQGDSLTPTAASATLMSMFQEDSVALKVVQPINYAKRRASAVAYIADAGWGDTSSTTA